MPALALQLQLRIPEITGKGGEILRRQGRAAETKQVLLKK
jgi:hypothetical protein